MQMTEAEIVRSYQHALNRTKQISILAELNACSKAEIRDILEKNGEEVPHYGNRYTGKVKPETKKEPKRSSVRMSERRKKKSDSSKMSTRLLKSEEQEDVGTCQQDVGTMSEDLGLSFEHSPEEVLKARSTAPTACQPAQPVDVWKPEKKESVPVPPEVIDASKIWLQSYEEDIEELEQKKKDIDEELENVRKTAERIRAWLDEVKKEGET